ncbi:MAG: response regulator transcription factor [Eubacteriaceae bacterium]|nr:response regulator transcription factor [Eubacteriaceae bacterium]
MANILLCDDDRDIVSALRIYLTPEGYNIYEAYDGKQALKAVEENDIHLILMDIMMPSMDGITATSLIRAKANIPIIMLSAKSEDTDKILGLNIGADDYITKPFNPAEVQARVRSALRRYTRLGGMTEKPERFVFGNITLDDAQKKVTVDSEEVSLTPIEFNILKLLMENPNKVFSTSQIYEMVWKEDSYGSEGAVAVHIRHLREKIEINPSQPRYLKVVWGLGYKMEKGKE